jgi:ubiquinone/menaquinone biosynthesis C-methylase UbiE
MSELHYARIADVYDDFVRTEVDVQFFIQEAQKANGEILELMAGTGRLTIPLLKAGISLTCVDYSAEMLERLREKLAQNHLSATVYQMDVRALKFDKRFPQIIIPFQAFHELASEQDQQLALQGIHDLLTDDGVFICTLHNPTLRLKSADGQLHLAGRFAREQNQLFVWLQQRYDPQTKLVHVLEFFEEYDSQGMMQSKRFSELQFQILEKSTFEQFIHAAGFEVSALYGDYTYSPFNEETSPFMIWLLRKQSNYR